MTTADMRNVAAEAKCFRPRRYYLVVGVACAVFFSVIGVASTVAACWNLDGSFPQPRPFALIFGIFWSAWTLLSAWVILAYFRERLLLAGKTVRQAGIIRSRVIDCEDGTRVDWRRWPTGGSIVVRTRSEKIAIYLHNFTTEEREELIRFFRETFANEIQENWSRFEEGAPRLLPPQRLTSRGGGVPLEVGIRPPSPSRTHSTRGRRP